MPFSGAAQVTTTLDSLPSRMRQLRTSARPDLCGVRRVTGVPTAICSVRVLLPVPIRSH